MTPEQLSKLQKLTLLFEEGLAGPAQIKELSELLAAINLSHDDSIFTLESSLQSSVSL